MNFHREAGRPWILGHRGASARETENTMAAFLAAMEDGADGVELDVRVCASGELLVFHDDDLVRLAGRSQRISDLPWAELKDVRIGAGHGIPLLVDVLSALRGARVNVEIKSPDRWQRARVARLVASTIDATDSQDNVIVSSFDPLALAAFRVIRPRIATGYLFHATQPRAVRGGLLAVPLRATAVHPDVKLVNHRRVERWRRLGLAINVWTVDDPSRMRELAELGVDAIITNRPQLAVEILG